MEQVLHLPRAVSAHAPAEWEAHWHGVEDWARLLPVWRESHQRYTPDDLDGDPEWCRGLEEVYPGAVRLVALRRHGQLAAVIPVVARRIELDCHLGEVRVARFRPRVLQLAGTRPALPDTDAAYDAFFVALLDRDSGAPPFEALRFVVPTQSFFGAYLERADFHRYRLRRYEPALPLAGPRSPSPVGVADPSSPGAVGVAHHLIRLPPTFADYVAKFTPKTRKNRFRELKYLEQRGPVELACFRRPDQVDAFLAEAEALSRRSYQHKLLKAGLRDTARLRPRLRIASEHGWLRAYILRCAGASCSYMLGYQYRGRYHYVNVGYDPEWAKWCVGTVLQLLVLQDLYLSDTPSTFDFGQHGPQKQYFGNEQFLERDVFFFRRGWYPWLACASYHHSRRATAHTAAWLDRHQLKPRIQRLIRRARGC